MSRATPTPEQISQARQSRCWLARFSDDPCRGVIQLAHLIPKQRLRQYHVPEGAIWDGRVLCFGCERHHGQLDMARTLRIPRDDLPPEVEAFAFEHGLMWSLDRDYGQ